MRVCYNYFDMQLTVRDLPVECDSVSVGIDEEPSRRFPVARYRYNRTGARSLAGGESVFLPMRTHLVTSSEKMSVLALNGDHVIASTDIACEELVHTASVGLALDHWLRLIAGTTADALERTFASECWDEVLTVFGVRTTVALMFLVILGRPADEDTITYFADQHRSLGDFSTLVRHVARSEEAQTPGGEVCREGYLIDRFLRAACGHSGLRRG